MENPLLKPTSPTANPEDAAKMLKPREEADEKIATFKIKGAKGKRFSKFVQQLKQNAMIAGLDIIHAELKSATREPHSMDADTVNIDPNKLSEPGFREGPLGPKISKSPKDKMKPGKMSPEELEKLGFNRPAWDRMTRDEREQKKAATQAGKTVEPDEDED